MRSLSLDPQVSGPRCYVESGLSQPLGMSHTTQPRNSGPCPKTKVFKVFWPDAVLLGACIMVVNPRKLGFVGDVEPLLSSGSDPSLMSQMHNQFGKLKVGRGRDQTQIYDLCGFPPLYRTCVAYGRMQTPSSVAHASAVFAPPLKWRATRRVASRTRCGGDSF